MPTVNIYYPQDGAVRSALLGAVQPLKDRIAGDLSGAAIALNRDEVSVRLIAVEGDGMIGDVEVEVKAHAFQERVARQDEICLALQEYLQSLLTDKEVKVWLALRVLGHSWQPAPDAPVPGSTPAATAPRRPGTPTGP